MRIKEYTTSVCQQIRWKKAHDVISEEIENQIIDQKNAFEAEGDNETVALEKAIEQMGDPINVGMLLDRTHRPKIEWGIIGLTVFLLLIGIGINYIMVDTKDGQYYFNRTILVTIIGTICMIIAYFADFTIIGRHYKALFGLLLLLMLSTIIFGESVNGASRWIAIRGLGGLRSAVFVLVIPTVYAGIIYGMRSKGYMGVAGCMASLALFEFILLNLRGMTGALTCAFICVALLTISVLKGWFNIKRLYAVIIVYAPLAVAAIAFFLLIFDRLKWRILSLSNIYGEGYIPYVTKEILSGSKFLGQGILPKQFDGSIAAYLPAINTDYVITYMVHSKGWIAFIVIVALLLIFAARGFYLCLKQKSVLGLLVSVSIMLTLFMQGFIYILTDLGLWVSAQPVLPFISYGGIAAVVNLGLTGILLSVFKSGYLIRDGKIKTEQRVIR